MKQLPKVLLLIPHLGGGGAEQVAALLAGGLSRDKYELHLGLMTQAAPMAGSLPPWIAAHGLGASRVRTAGFRLLCLIRRLKPDLIVSGMAHLNFLVLLLRPLFPGNPGVLIRQNGTVSAALESRDLPSYSRLLYRLLYRHADRVICQSRAMADDLGRELGIREARLAVLPNPVDVEEIRRTAATSPGQWTGPGPHLLAVGRLSREKGFDLLLEALAAVRMRIPSADLAILGAGREESALNALRAQLGLQAAVRLAGRVACPYGYFQGATLFVLSSRYEGLPNALLEAAAAGLPIVAMPSSGGVVELLQGRPGVWLAPEVSVDALASTLQDALASLGPDERFAHSFVEQFRIGHAIAAYEDLIDEVLREGRL